MLDEEDEIELGYAPTFNTSVADVSMLNVSQLS